MDFQGVYLSRIFLEFFPKPAYSTMVVKKFQIYSVTERLLANTFASQKIESVHVYSCPKAKLSHRFLPLSPGRTKLSIPLEQRFLKIFFSEQKGGEDYGVEKIPKLTRI